MTQSLHQSKPDETLYFSFWQKTAGFSAVNFNIYIYNDLGSHTHNLSGRRGGYGIMLNLNCLLVVTL